MKHQNNSPPYSPSSFDHNDDNDDEKKEEENDNDAGEAELSSYNVEAESGSEKHITPINI